MTDEDLLRRRKQAQTTFKMKFRGASQETIEDFGSFCVEQWLKGRCPGTKYYHLVIDYLRLNRREKGDHKHKGSMDLLAQPTRSKFSVLENRSEESKDIDRFTSDQIRDKRLSQKERIILILYFEWGFHIREIGDVFGRGESWASIELNSALESVKSNLALHPLSCVKG